MSASELTGRDETWLRVLRWSAWALTACLVAAGILYVWAKRVAIDPNVCQCEYAPEQLISQDRTLEMVMGIGDWFIAGALLLAGLGMLAIPALVLRSGLSPGWGRASQVIAVLFFVAVLALLFEVDIVFQLSAAIGSVILLPTWALWLERQARTERISTSP